MDFKIDSIGNMEWQQCIGSHAIEVVHGAIQEGDTKYALAGEMSFSPSFDVNCSNFIYGSSRNYWVFGISDTTVNTPEYSVKNREITIYPVPAINMLNIDFPSGFDIENTITEIIDINGLSILSFKPSKLKTHLDINNIVPGLYIIKIQNDKTLITKKFVKK